MPLFHSLLVKSAVHDTFLDDEVFKKYDNTASARSFFKSAVNVNAQFSYFVLCRMIFTK